MDEAKTCSSCRWWGRWDEGFCGKIEMDSMQAPETARAEIVVKVADDYGLDARLRTAPDFGCIHHTPRGA